MYENLIFHSNSENLLIVIKELAIAWILCGRRHVYLSAKSLLMAMLYSLIARRQIILKQSTYGVMEDLSLSLSLSACLMYVRVHA